MKRKNLKKKKNNIKYKVRKSTRKKRNKSYLCSCIEDLHDSLRGSVSLLEVGKFFPITVAVRIPTAKNAQLHGKNFSA
jgi:hypothetical protein